MGWSRGSPRLERGSEEAGTVTLVRRCWRGPGPSTLSHPASPGLSLHRADYRSVISAETTARFWKGIFLNATS